MKVIDLLTFFGEVKSMKRKDARREAAAWLERLDLGGFAQKKAEELSKSLLNFKDLFLVGFFLSIGLSGAPTPEMVLIALLLLIAVPAKG